MTLGSQLDRLRNPAAFPPIGRVVRRWGQLLREQPDVSDTLRELQTRQKVVPLGSVATISSGVVPRANAYFIVRELPFADVPRRFRLTRNDYARVAVVLDGIGAPFRIERQFLRPIIKGPDALLSPTQIQSSDLRLFDVNVSKEDLRKAHATGALEYLRRGETFAYRVSKDELKGGIPAERAQVKIRKPYWYSLHVPERTERAIVVPEHYDTRYIAALLPSTDHSVVIDTLYSIEPHKSSFTRLLLMSLNSILAWYQVELRGRTQHGQGVLKVKIPDFQGLLVLNPNAVTSADRRELELKFRALAGQNVQDSLKQLVDIAQNEFDESLFRVMGFTDPPGSRRTIERDLRAAIAERKERRLSVEQDRIERRRVRGTANIDGFATRIAAGMQAYPDPRDFIPRGASLTPVGISSKVDGPITVGVELFDQGEVYSAGVRIAHAPDMLSARFVRGVLLRDSELPEVLIPARDEIAQIVAAWDAAAREWRKEFDRLTAKITQDISDPRLRAAAEHRALVMLHAE